MTSQNNTALIRNAAMLGTVAGLAGTVAGMAALQRVSQAEEKIIDLEKKVDRLEKLLEEMWKYSPDNENGEVASLKNSYYVRVANISAEDKNLSS